MFFAETAGKGAGVLGKWGEQGFLVVYTPWTTQKSTSMSMGDIHLQVGAETNLMLPLTETRLPGTAYLLTSYAWPGGFPVLITNSWC